MKIAFVGASGYGNAGDDTYPIVFATHLQGHELLFHNSDLPANLPDDIAVLVIGGGGLLHNVGAEPEPAESPHFACMRHYMDWAIAKGISWGFLSCGFQFEVNRDDRYAEALKPWVPYLQAAHFITLRSPACVRIAHEISGRSDVLVFPDAAYLFQPVNPTSVEKQNVLTLVLAGLINPKNVHTLHCIKHFQSIGMHIVWMGMGADVDDAMLLEEAARKFPNAHVISNPGPQEAFRQIACSRFVMTGRYHGMVYARRLGIPYFVPLDAPYKIQHEDLSADMSKAIGHMETLRSVISKLVW